MLAAAEGRLTALLVPFSGAPELTLAIEPDLINSQGIQQHDTVLVIILTRARVRDDPSTQQVPRSKRPRQDHEDEQNHSGGPATSDPYL